MTASMGIIRKHLRAGVEPAGVRRSPLQGAGRAPGLSPSAEFNALLRFDFPLPPVPGAVLQQKAGQCRVRRGGMTPASVGWGHRNQIARAEWPTPAPEAGS